MVQTIRPNRVQPRVCRRVITDALGEEKAELTLCESGVADLPNELPSGPRDLEALARELQPFVDLYRVLLKHTDREIALQVMRRAIIESGAVSHASDAEHALTPTLSHGERVQEPLNLTSPPPEGFSMPDDELQESFRLAMAYFSCEGELLAYSPEFVRFRITSCNWCKAMQNAGAPELIPFICETDERFMDNHPTHRLRRPTAIGLGDSDCDFQFMPIEGLSTIS